MGAEVQPAQPTLFLALINALAVQERLAPEVGVALDRLAAAVGLQGREALFETHAGLVIDQLSAEHAGGGARRARAEPAAFQHGGPDPLVRQLISNGAADHSATHDNYIRVL